MVLGFRRDLLCPEHYPRHLVFALLALVLLLLVSFECVIYFERVKLSKRLLPTLDFLS